MTVKMQVD